MRAPISRWLPIAASLAVLASAAATTGCPPPPPHTVIEMEPIGTHAPIDPVTTDSDGGDSPTASAADNTTPSDTPQDKPGDCSGARFENIYLPLTNRACEVDAKNDKPQDIKDLLEVRLQASTPQIVPGGRVDLVLTYRNKSTKPLPLSFVLDPSPRFDVDALDLRGRLVAIPKGKAPKQPSRANKSTARITLAPGGVAKMKLGWNASNTRWATEQVKGGQVPDSGYPKAQTTPLAKGTYTLRLVTPLTLVEEGAEHDLTAPRLLIEVTE